MKAKKTNLLLAMAMSISSLSTSYGAITLVNTGSGGGAGVAETVDNSNPQRLTAFNPGSADKLVVVISHEKTGANNSTAYITSVTFGAASLTRIAFVGDQNETSIWHLDSPSSTAADITVNAINTNGMGISALTLLGTASGFSATAGSGNQTVSLTTLTANEFIVAGFAANNVTGAVVSAASPATVFHNYNGSGDAETGSSIGGAAYQAAGAAGSYTTTFSNTGGAPGRPSSIAVSFAAIPEPSSLLLLSLGTLGFFRRSRT